jgi:hypothetical protein
MYSSTPPTSRLPSAPPSVSTALDPQPTTRSAPSTKPNRTFKTSLEVVAITNPHDPAGRDRPFPICKFCQLEIPDVALSVTKTQNRHDRFHDLLAAGYNLGYTEPSSAYPTDKARGLLVIDYQYEINVLEASLEDDYEEPTASPPRSPTTGRPSGPQVGLFTGEPIPSYEEYLASLEKPQPRPDKMTDRSRHLW